MKMMTILFLAAVVLILGIPGANAHGNGKMCHAHAGYTVHCHK